MNIDVRKFAPKQVESVNAEELTEALEQFKSVGAQVLAAEEKLKVLEAKSIEENFWDDNQKAQEILKEKKQKLLKLGI